MANALLDHSPAGDSARYQLAEMNLMSAIGLPGTEEMDIGAMLGTLDAWANQVALTTRKSIGAYHVNRAKFGSLAEFRIAVMIHVLCDEIGIRYNPARLADPENFDDPADSFIHGLLGPKRTGTCASLPVLLVAMGRKLGYPLKLKLAPAHCFCCWDAPEERFNIEWHEGGLNSHPDEHYREWPYKWTPELYSKEREQGMFLFALAPQQELSHFAHMRAAHLAPLSGRLNEALETMRVAYELWPNRSSIMWITHLMTKLYFGEKEYPHMPCEETAGKAALDRLARENIAVSANVRPTG
ncbi:MAG TPA: transglutaminase family protein [Tepidisphaeraceae bacterium]|jgi:hypothetical protein|nr:transglutaminase family protein [Tepidisphaeraceae bacterium]